MLMTLTPSSIRRVLAAATLGALAMILLWIALAHPPIDPFWMVALFLLGCGAGVAAWRNWQATSHGIVLRTNGVFSTSGECLAALEQMVKVDRGFFAFKPSGGFVVVLSERAPRRWEPGLWWRSGRRLGVGGTLPAAGCRAMADALTALVAEHRRQAAGA